MLALVERRPCVMHDFDDELEMAKWAEAAWPCAKSTRIRKSIEAERAAQGTGRPIQEGRRGEADQQPRHREGAQRH